MPLVVEREVHGWEDPVIFRDSQIAVWRGIILKTGFGDPICSLRICVGTFEENNDVVYIYDNLNDGKKITFPEPIYLALITNQAVEIDFFSEHDYPIIPGMKTTYLLFGDAEMPTDVPTEVEFYPQWNVHSRIVYRDGRAEVHVRLVSRCHRITAWFTSWFGKH